MTSIISNIHDLIEQFPYVLRDHENSWNSPCPFCSDNSGEIHTHHEQRFVGHDRLVWYPHQKNPKFYCRQERRTYNLKALAERLKLILSPSLLTNDYEEDESTEAYEKPLADLWLSSAVDAAHAQVRREYWYQFGWSDELIDRFRLGYGKLYQSEGHIIPMRLHDLEGNLLRFWYIAQRIPGHGGSIKSPGDPRKYYWKIEATQKEIAYTPTAFLVEGEKDAISAAYLFPEYDIYTSFGSNLWTAAQTKVLSEHHQEIWVFGDHDSAGEHWNIDVCGWLDDQSCAYKTLAWEESFTEKFDLTDLLAQEGLSKTRNYILTHMRIPDYDFAAGVTRPRFIETLKHPQPVQTDNFITISELRGDGEFSIKGQIKEFLETYRVKKKLGYGLLKLLAAPPGVGKTHLVLDHILELAKESLLERKAQKRILEDQVIKLSLDTKPEDQELLESLQRKLEDFSFNQTAWFGQYVSGYQDLMELNTEVSQYVFNYEARHHENCQNFELIQELGRNNHDIGRFCTLACPFKAACEKSGYLSQEIKRRAYPVVYYRHPHLSIERTQNPIELVVIDENPTHMMDEPLIVKQREVQPILSTWALDLADSAQAHLIEGFAKSIRAAMSYNAGIPRTLYGVENPDYTISGAAFLRILDQHIKSFLKSDLETILGQINLEALSAYQPTYLYGDHKLIKKRCIEGLYEIIQRELPAYLEDKDNSYPSCIQLVGGTLELYFQEPLRISSNKPIIALDATALPKLYEIMFHRYVDVFKPEIKNPKARTIAFSGAGFSKSWTLTQIGKGYREITKFIETASGEHIEIEQIPISPQLYDSTIIQEALTLIEGLANQHQHLLIVTHKILRETLEWIIKGAHPDYKLKTLKSRIAFAHFNEVRGTNRFKDFDSVLILGAYRIPYDVAWRKINSWLWHMGEHDAVPKDTIIEERAFNGQNSGNGVRTIDHWFAREYLDAIEMGEIRQCAERIRPHSSEDAKTIYYLGSRPALPYVTEIWSRQVLVRQLSDTQLSALEQTLFNFAIDYIAKFNEISFPPIALLRNEWGLHNTTIQASIGRVLTKLVVQYPEIQLANKYQKYLG